MIDISVFLKRILLKYYKPTMQCRTAASFRPYLACHPKANKFKPIISFLVSPKVINIPHSLRAVSLAIKYYAGKSS